MKRFILSMTIFVCALPFVFGCVGRCKDCGKIVKTTVLTGVHFDFDKAVIKPDGKPILNKDVELLKKEKVFNITIEGHCDVLGSDEYNQLLSERRAKSVYEYFLANNIPADRMNTVGLGRKKPVASNDNASNRAKNRRVEIHVMKAK